MVMYDFRLFCVSLVAAIFQMVVTLPVKKWQLRTQLIKDFCQEMLFFRQQIRKSSLKFHA